MQVILCWKERVAIPRPIYLLPTMMEKLRLASQDAIITINEATAYLCVGGYLGLLLSGIAHRMRCKIDLHLGTWIRHRGEGLGCDVIVSKITLREMPYVDGRAVFPSPAAHVVPVEPSLTQKDNSVCQDTSWLRNRTETNETKEDRAQSL